MKKYQVRKRVHDDLVRDLLDARGVVGEEAITRFLSPEFERDSHDPFLLPDMHKAVERIVSAKQSNEQVAVWSDYDCDGIPGGVLLTEYLRSIGLSVRHYIPHRHREGYGLNVPGLDELSAQGIKLVITVDLGTTNHAEISYAQSKGMDVIVTDHHIVSDSLSPAFALINPKRPDSEYPFDGLCGAGVAWKLVQAILSKNRPKGFAEGREKWLLDLVALGTLSDMVPLVGENRMLAHYGLLVMRRNHRPGLAALLSLLRIKPHTLQEDDIGFMVAPRINAASRMDSPELAARLLATQDGAEADDLAHSLNAINDERKGLVASIVKEANKRLALSGQDSAVLIMGSPNWRPGVLGLVANSLMQAHHKPVFLWGREGGDVLRGSCRSDGSTNIVELMQKVSDVFDHFGGHAASGGFSILEERVHELAPRLLEAFGHLQAEGALQEKEICIDRELELAEVTHALRELTHLAPFGADNAKPLFMLGGVSVGNVRMFGKQQNHLDLVLSQGSTTVSGVSFFSTIDSFQKPIVSGMRADIVGHIETDWNGRPRVRVVDIL